MMSRLKYLLATGFGTGYSPLIPGTAGSLAAWLAYVLIPLPALYWLLITALTVLAGLWACSALEAAEGKDPGKVVIDEFAGQWLTLIFLPRDIWLLVLGFFLFRILDILKPYPASRLEQLSGSPGIMLDDLVAAVYANLTLQVICFFLN